MYGVVVYQCIVGWGFMFRLFCFFFSSRRRHTRCALVTGVQTCALPISVPGVDRPPAHNARGFWRDAYRRVRDETERRVAHLSAEDQIVQSMEIGRASCRERVCQYV